MIEWLKEVELLTLKLKYVDHYFQALSLGSRLSHLTLQNAFHNLSRASRK